ncbi:MAG: hypothetical protein H6707_08220 [Deltaproteobacteria bacterium]|nr:hypothetical protein [Deltaproteobacteria bacterium]
MKPTTICRDILGAERLRSVFDELSALQVKMVLKKGRLNAKVGAGIVSQQKKRTVWFDRLSAAITEGNDLAAGEMLEQWLLNHHREMLIAFLSHLGVKHDAGETDENFLLSKPREEIQASANALLRDERFDGPSVRAYLLYIAYQQRSAIFDDYAPVISGVAEGS